MHPHLIPRRVIFAFLLAAGIAGCGMNAPDAPSPSASAPVELKIAAAADLLAALKDVAAAFHKSQSDVTLTITHGASGQLFMQLENGAPFDVFLSADMQYPRKLIEQDLAIADSEFLYAHGHLVVWTPRDSVLDIEGKGIDVLLDPAVKKIAIANPEFAPYGRVAQAALKKLDLYDQVQDRLVLGENISQTAQFVESGAADVGIIALSLALAPAMKDKGRFTSVPTDAYPTLEQGGVIMRHCEHPDLAVHFRDFLLGSEGRTILRSYGFELPKE